MSENEIKEKLKDWKEVQQQIKDIFTKISYLDELDDYSRSIVDAYIALDNICKREIRKYTEML